MQNPSCPRCHTELAMAKIRPEALPHTPEGQPLPGPYLFCMAESLIVSVATGEPEVIGSLR